jgi:hypothetical protein
MTAPLTVLPARQRGWFKPLLAGLCAVLVVAAGLLFSQREQLRLAAQSYVFGYPLVMMDITRQHFLSSRGPENQLYQMRAFPDASFREVVRPNVDTLYTIAWLNLQQEPQVLELPKNPQRYYLMPLLDAWTNVFASPGTRTNTDGSGPYLLVGPNWQGELPAGLSLLRAPTSMVWLIGRTQTNGVADYPQVHAQQDQYKLRSLADWQTGKSPVAAAWQVSSEPLQAPLYQLRAMSAQQFFTRLQALLANNPPSAGDAAAMAQLQALGAPADWGVLKQGLVKLSMWLANRRMESAWAAGGALVNGWSTPPAAIGNYADNYGLRAAVAMMGLGANTPDDAMYPNTKVDADGQPLDGSQRYRLHLSAEQLPPVNAFWSLTAYDRDGFLIANQLNRFALGDRDPLTFNSDGSLDLYLQATEPDAAQRSNWLPSTAQGPFLLNMRLYWPKATALQGQWQMPAIQRLD